MVDKSVKINLNDPHTQKVLEDMGTSLEESRSGKKHPKEIKYLEGILDSIPEIRNVYASKHNGVSGPGGRSWFVYDGVQTTLKIKAGEKVKKVEFYGLILQDSIGNELEVYKTDESISAIYDKKLNRWYINREQD